MSVDTMDDGRKILVIIMDGLGDRAVKSLGYKTPLQCANKPNIDWFAANGTSGIMDVIAPGVRPGSDTSHLAILGYDPFEVYTGRGPSRRRGWAWWERQGMLRSVVTSPPWTIG